MGLGNDLRKYINYIFDTRSFDPRPDRVEISDRALGAARSIRGVGRPPALIIHGVMPRSGTVYVGELLRQHPDLYAYPNEIWELPFLQQTGEVEKLQKKFLLAYEQNIGKIGNYDFLPIFGSSLIVYLYSFLPPEARMLLKVPGVQYLTYFFSMFPGENLLLLVRDGRDLVHSTIRTWPQLRFSFACRRWERSARMVLECHKRYSEKSEGYWLARFEDAVRDPTTFVKTACDRFGLDETKYPYDQIDTISLHGSSAVKKRGAVDWNAATKPPGFNPTGRWQQWSAGKKRTFKRIAGQALMDLGYCDDLDW